MSAREKMVCASLGLYLRNRRGRREEILFPRKWGWEGNGLWLAFSLLYIMRIREILLLVTWNYKSW